MYTTYSSGFPIWVPIVGFVVGIACAFGSYFIAQRSGRSGGGYAVLGFFLGIIGLIITLIVCRNPVTPPQLQYQQPYPPQQQPPFPQQQAPYQQPPIQGPVAQPPADNTTGGTIPNAVTTPPVGQARFCTGCGARTAPEESFCSNCGQKMSVL